MLSPIASEAREVLNNLYLEDDGTCISFFLYGGLFLAARLGPRAIERHEIIRKKLAGTNELSFCAGKLISSITFNTVRQPSVQMVISILESLTHKEQNNNLWP